MKQDVVVSLDIEDLKAGFDIDHVLFEAARLAAIDGQVNVRRVLLQGGSEGFEGMGPQVSWFLDAGKSVVVVLEDRQPSTYPPSLPANLLQGQRNEVAVVWVGSRGALVWDGSERYAHDICVDSDGQAVRELMVAMQVPQVFDQVVEFANQDRSRPILSPGLKLVSAGAQGSRSVGMAALRASIKSLGERGPGPDGAISAQNAAEDLLGALREEKQDSSTNASETPSVERSFQELAHELRQLEERVGSPQAAYERGHFAAVSKHLEVLYENHESFLSDLTGRLHRTDSSGPLGDEEIMNLRWLGADKDSSRLSASESDQLVMRVRTAVEAELEESRRFASAAQFASDLHRAIRPKRAEGLVKRVREGFETNWERVEGPVVQLGWLLGWMLALSLAAGALGGPVCGLFVGAAAASVVAILNAANADKDQWSLDWLVRGGASCVVGGFGAGVGLGFVRGVSAWLITVVFLVAVGVVGVDFRRRAISAFLKRFRPNDLRAGLAKGRSELSEIVEADLVLNPGRELMASTARGLSELLTAIADAATHWTPSELVPQLATGDTRNSDGVAVISLIESESDLAQHQARLEDVIQEEALHRLRFVVDDLWHDVRGNCLDVDRVGIAAHEVFDAYQDEVQHEGVLGAKEVSPASGIREFLSVLWRNPVVTEELRQLAKHSGIVQLCTSRQLASLDRNDVKLIKFLPEFLSVDVDAGEAFVRTDTPAIGGVIRLVRVTHGAIYEREIE